MKIVAAIRFDHDKLRQIVADYVGAQLKLEVPAAKVSLYSDPSDRTGCRVEASVDVSDHAKVAT